MSETDPSIGASVEVEGVVHEVYFSPSYRRLLFVFWVCALVLTPGMFVGAVYNGPWVFWCLGFFLGFGAITLPLMRNAPVVKVLEDGSLLVRSTILIPWSHRLSPGWCVVERGPTIVFLDGKRQKAAWPENALGWKPEEVPRLLSLNAATGPDDSNKASLSD